MRHDHLPAKTSAVNQLGALQAADWPGAKAIFAGLDSPIALSFLERYPNVPGSPTPGRSPVGRLLGTPLLQRPPHPSGAAGPPARRPVTVNSLDARCSHPKLEQ